MQRLAHPLCGVATHNTLLHSGATNGTKSLRLDPYGVPPCRHGGLPPRPMECLLPGTSENPIKAKFRESTFHALG
jgi:hypothetical protein